MKLCALKYHENESILEVQKKHKGEINDSGPENDNGPENDSSPKAVHFCFTGVFSEMVLPKKEGLPEGRRRIL